MSSAFAKSRPEETHGRVWHFAGCEFDESRYRLRVNGNVVELEAKPLEILHQLLLRNGEVAKKEDLLEAVWPGVMVVDASLATAVSKLRKALHDDGEVIKTVPKVGYRFAAPLRFELAHADVTVSTAGSTQVEPVVESKIPAERISSRPPRLWFVPMIALIAIAVSLSAFRKPTQFDSGAKAVAILPFQNLSSDHSVDYLKSALPDQIANTLSAAHSLELRPLSSTSRYSNVGLDLREVGRDLSANRIITGTYLVAGDQLQITIEAVDANENRVLWHDTVNVPANNLLTLQTQVAATSRSKLAGALGVTEFVQDTTPPPKNEQAYELYLRSIALGWDTASINQGVDLLRRSVAIDPSFGPAWGQLSLRYYWVSRFGGGGPEMLELSDAAAEKQLAVEPDSPDPAIELTIHQTERGDTVRAHQRALELVRRRPDNANTHHLLSYVLRYGGSVDESVRQCEMTLLLAYKFVWGACSTSWMEAGDYKKAREFIRKDLSTEFSKAHAIEVDLRQGNIAEVLKIPAPNVPGWDSYKMVQACAAQRPETEIKALASKVTVNDDPEVNYFFAAHLAYCGQTDAALKMLKTTIDENYCSYPAIDRDPLFDKIRNTPGFAKVRSAAFACHDDFVNSRERLARR